MTYASGYGNMAVRSADRQTFSPIQENAIMVTPDEEKARQARLLRWTENVIRVWNWPLVLSGDLSHEELEDEVQARSGMMAHMDSATMAACVLSALPDSTFYNA